MIELMARPAASHHGANDSAVAHGVAVGYGDRPPATLYGSDPPRMDPRALGRRQPTVHRNILIQG